MRDEDMGKATSNFAPRAIFIAACVALLTMTCIASYLSKKEMTLSESDFSSSRTYTGLEQSYKSMLSGKWFSPYTTEDCAVLLEEGTQSECLPGVDGHTLIFDRESEASALFGPLFNTKTYECGWDVRSSAVYTVCGLPREEFKAFTIREINENELIAMYDPDLETLVRYRRVTATY